MKSHKVIRKVLRQANAKQVAVDAGVSLSTLYKWSEEGASRRRNPLELAAALARSTGDRRLVQWQCAEAGGFFVENPKAVKLPPESFVAAVFRLERELAGLQALLAQAGQHFSAKEMKRLRKRWDRVKSAVESFVVADEAGMFRRLPAQLFWLLGWWFTTGEVAEV